MTRPPRTRRARVLCLLTLLAAALLANASGATADEAAGRRYATRTVGRLSAVVDLRFAHPGGLLIVGLRRPLGTTYAALLGRKVPFLDGPAGPRALVPIPATAPSGAVTLGFEVWARRGRQRVPMEIILRPRTYPPRTLVIPETRRHLLQQPAAVAGGRRLLRALRTLTRAALWTVFRQPVTASSPTFFGAMETCAGGSPVNYLSDGILGEDHRGADYDVPPGTAVRAPAGGTVVFAAHLPLTGHTLAIDHGQGVVSALYHMTRLGVAAGDVVVAGSELGLSGESGIAPRPHLHWGTYVHGVAVDPEVLLALPD